MKYVKDFQKMNPEACDKLPVRFGPVKATAYSYREILGSEQEPTRKQLWKFQKELGWIVSNKLDDDPNLLLLLTLEFGSSSCTLAEFCTQYRALNAKSYLLDTPFDMLKADYRRACDFIRETCEMG